MNARETHSNTIISLVIGKHAPISSYVLNRIKGIEACHDFATKLCCKLIEFGLKFKTLFILPDFPSIRPKDWSFRPSPIFSSRSPRSPKSLRSSSEVMDRNKDGKLVMEEVEPCLIPGTYRYREFHKALKMSTPEAFKDNGNRQPGFKG